MAIGKHVALGVSSAFALAAATAFAGDNAAFVNPFIGTMGKGHCNPGATRPFAMVQPGPDTGAGEWRYCAGYQYGDRTIMGFSQNHLCGTGQGEMGDVLLLPFRGDEVLRRSAFSHANETASPGYYAVTLDDAKVRAELTCTDRVACHRYTYLGEGPAHLLVDLQHGLVGESEWANKMTIEGYASFSEDGLSMHGSRLVRQYWPLHRVFFHAAFSRPVKARRLLEKELPTENGDRWVLDFDIEPGGTLEVRVAISYASAEGALGNYKTEAEGRNFDAIRAFARAAWNEILSRVETEGATDGEKTALYTALYHLCWQPNTISDAGAKMRYSTFSFWDTYRAAHPLYTLLAPERVDGFVDSILDHAKTTGHMPIWEIYGLEGYDMLASHSIPVVMDAWSKGFKVDLEAFWPYVKHTLTTDNRETNAARVHKPFISSHWNLLDSLGFFPCDVVTWESMSRMMETPIDDWCAAEMAKALGKGEDEAYFRARSRIWRNMFKPGTGWIWPRLSDGSWVEGYDPCWMKRPKGFPGEGRCDTAEGSSVQWSFHVMHDFPGLVEALGGMERFREKLDFIFTHKPFWVDDKSLEEEWPYREVCGNIGEYAHGNEPCHHLPWLWSLAGDRAKTAKTVREVAERFYIPAPDGLCGNDDCGQMSAWYVFAAMGFYPVNPASAEYVAGEPLFPAMRISLPGGKTLEIRKGGRPGITLGGKTVQGVVLRHEDLVKGGTLEFGSTETEARQ